MRTTLTTTLESSGISLLMALVQHLEWKHMLRHQLPNLQTTFIRADVCFHVDALMLCVCKVRTQEAENFDEEVKS